jgi:hypothetical protein
LEGRGTCSPKLREEHRAMEIQNKVYKCRPKIYELIDERMKLHNMHLQDWYHLIVLSFTNNMKFKNKS